ncbi:lysine specific demethylase 5a [Trichuris trichiura]|uniref:[histone H3]-trimethyl-L-lysine(4) demethylase n=1 Tax=Trichuris trichiura TaxID=36087 RepID=A0A077YX30_TRITR|nr:lysine specific demethylase 5a [Trichuris trichiura]
MTSPQLSFTKPPVAPVVFPTAAEFSNPFSYFRSLKLRYEKFGIVKIVPPEGWNPQPRANNLHLSFVPRLQKLNELNAMIRGGDLFMNDLTNFWKLRGVDLRVPLVEGHFVDLYALYKLVMQRGGFEACCAQHKWSELSRLLEYKGVRAVPLKSHYERILLPFEIVESEKAKKKESLPIDTEAKTEDKGKEEELQSVVPGEEHCPEGEATEEGATVGDEPLAEEHLRKRPARAEIVTGKKIQKTDRIGAKMRGEKRRKTVQVDDIVCSVCGGGDCEDRLLLCEACPYAYHTFCLVPPLSDIPYGVWFCPRCIQLEYVKALDWSGFELDTRQYTIEEFKQEVDEFKARHFAYEVCLYHRNVSADEVEKEFWRLVCNPNGNVIVKYAADLSTSEVGSGFPQRDDPALTPDQLVLQMAFGFVGPLPLKYARSPWNLNNLACSPESALSFIDKEILRIKVPSMHIGSCFSTFCWHIEDHWAYSINYLHWGEPRTWYGVSSMEATKFETAMKDLAPKLFKEHPNVLHHLITLINPTLLMNRGVNIYTVMQESGQFVLTFPRAYHAGFNHGLNCAEAVNLFPADWISTGRECIANYKESRRTCVFSHDELVCRMADCEGLALEMRRELFCDLNTMINLERKLRSITKDHPVNERCIIENIGDDKRRCEICRTTVFLSCVECHCARKDRTLCLEHVKGVCLLAPCGDCTFKYRFTMEQLDLLRAKVRDDQDGFYDWFLKADELLKRGYNQRDLTVDEVAKLIAAAENNGYTQAAPFDKLRRTKEEHDRWENLAIRMLARLSSSNDITRARKDRRQEGLLSLQEVEDFCRLLDACPCKIRDRDELKALVADVSTLQKNLAEAQQLMTRKCNAITEADVQYAKEVLDRSKAFNLRLSGLRELQQNLQFSVWLKHAQTALRSNLCEPLPTIEELDTIIEEGKALNMEEKTKGTLDRLEQRRGDYAAEALLSCDRKMTADTFAAKAREIYQVPVADSLVLKVVQIAIEAESVNSEVRRVMEQGTHLAGLKELWTRIQLLPPVFLFPLHLDQTVLKRLELLTASLTNLFVGKTKSSCTLLQRFLHESDNVQEVEKDEEPETKAVVPKPTAVPEQLGSPAAQAEVLPTLSAPAEPTAAAAAAPMQWFDHWKGLENFTTVDQLRKALEEAKLRRFEELNKTRKMWKSLHEAAKRESTYGKSGQKICICKQACGSELFASDQLVICWLCLAPYHIDCIVKMQCSSGLNELGIFLCPYCCRTTRPTEAQIDRFRSKQNSGAKDPLTFEIFLFKHLSYEAKTCYADVECICRTMDIAYGITNTFVVLAEDVLVRTLMCEIEVGNAKKIIDLAKSKFNCFCTAPIEKMTENLKRNISAIDEKKNGEP